MNGTGNKQDNSPRKADVTLDSCVYLVILIECRDVSLV